jgi:excisionase family DNA binding protein
VSAASGMRSNRELGYTPGPIELVQKLEATPGALRARDLAELFGVTQQHIYKLAARGVIPSFRVGTAVRFDPAMVAEWLRRKISPTRAGIAAVRVAV